MPVTILRVNTLPKNAPLELEMVAVPNKQELKQHRINDANILLEKNGEIQYLFTRFDSLEDFLSGDLDLFSKQEPKEGRDAILRVDVYHPVNVTLDPKVMDHIRRLKHAAYSFIPVLDCLHAKSLDQMKGFTNTNGLVITVEYI